MNDKSDLENKLHEALDLLQQASEMSWEYPNPYSGIPSPLTKSILIAQQWLKKALGETVASDIEKARNGKENLMANSYVGRETPPSADD